MQFGAKELVIKISASDMLKSKAFYETILDFKVDDRYTINVGGNFGAESYIQMNLMSGSRKKFVIGLYQDIQAPYNPMPQTGTVPSFIVDDIEKTLKTFLDKNVVVDKIDGQYIVSNTSDKGFTDHFFFFRDPDNNSLVIRQNLKKVNKKS